MGMCPNCGKKMGLMAGGVKVEGIEVCKECAPVLQERIQKRKEILKQGVEDILVVTSSVLEGYKIEKYLGFVSAQVVMGVDVFRDFFASIRDLVGGRSRALQYEFKNAEGTALQELKIESALRGGNGVINVKMDYEMIETGHGKIIMVVANGTAVEVEKMERK